jgi:hypothetical protein
MHTIQRYKMNPNNLKALEKCIRLAKMKAILETIGKGPTRYIPKANLHPCYEQAFMRVQSATKKDHVDPFVRQHIVAEGQKINRKINLVLFRAMRRRENDEFLHLFFSDERGVVAFHYLLLSGLIENKVDDFKHLRNFTRILYDVVGPDEDYEDPATGSAKWMRKYRQKLDQESQSEE